MSIFKGPSFTNRADKINQITATIAEFGVPVPYLFGTSKVGSNLIEYSEFQSIERRTTTKSGKSKSTQIDYDYYAKVVLAICSGNNDNQIGAVWIGGNKYDSIGTLNSSGAEGSGLTYAANGGTPYSQQYDDLSMCYGRVYLGRNNASVPSYEFEVKGLYRTNNGDANPADVIKFLLFEIGLENYIDNTSWEDYKRFCQNAGLLVSTPRDYFNSQKKAQEIVKDLLTLTNTFMFWSVDKFKFAPCYPAALGNWRPNLTVRYNLNENHFLKDSFHFKRKDSTQQYNVVKVNFTNRANNYEKESISYINTEDVQRVGVKQTEVDASWIHHKESAVKIAKMLSEKYANEITQYSFKLDWAFARLEPSDLVKISNKTLNIDEVVRITEITQDKNRVLSVTAISTPVESYGQAQYTVRNDYEYIDYNVQAGNTDTPLFIIPPSDLVSTSNAGVELWIGLRGTTNQWGGCTVHASYDDLTYAEAGVQPLESLYGIVLADNGTTIDVKLGNLTQKELISNQLVWINGEVLSYESAILTDFNTYTLTNCQRGLHGTTEDIHSRNEEFAVLDSSLFCVQLNKSDVGKVIHFKFPSFNIFKTMGEDINQLDSYATRIALADLPNVKNVVAYNKYRELSDDITRYDIEVKWEVPNMDSYAQAQVWYKTSGTQANNIGVIQEGVLGNEIGFEGSWLFGGQGYDSVTIPQAVIGDTYRIAVCTQDIYGYVESPDVSAQTEILVAIKSETPNTPANISIDLTDTFNISWEEIRNADIKYYEVRTDRFVGVNSPQLIVRTTETKFSTTNITERQGMIYVFGVSAYDKASAPATLQYNFPAPIEPFIQCESKLAGIECRVSSIPNNSLGVHWFFDGTDSDNDITTDGITYFYQANAGVYQISACYFDYFGDGNICPKTTVSIKAYIDSSLIQDEAMTVEKLSKDVRKAIEEGGVDTVNIAVKGMLGEGSALVMQPSGELALVASNGEILTGMFVNKDGSITLDGKYIHITGDTKIDGNTITNNMLADGIDADKINANTFSALWANVGTLQSISADGLEATLISPRGGSVYARPDTSSEWVLRVRWGHW